MKKNASVRTAYFYGPAQTSFVLIISRFLGGNDACCYDLMNAVVIWQKYLYGTSTCTGIQIDVSRSHDTSPRTVDKAGLLT